MIELVPVTKFKQQTVERPVIAKEKPRIDDEAPILRGYNTFFWFDEFTEQDLKQFHDRADKGLIVDFIKSTVDAFHELIYNSE